MDFQQVDLEILTACCWVQSSKLRTQQAACKLLAISHRDSIEIPDLKPTRWQGRARQGKAARSRSGASRQETLGTLRLLALPEHLLVQILGSLGHGSLSRAARTCRILSNHDLVDDAAKLAIENSRFSPELRSCAPKTVKRRWVHILAELEIYQGRPLMFCQARSTVVELSAPRAELSKCWMGPASML
eukprot:COSAG02_NODE_28418_length_590_cov_0.733198_1_plen_187_part_01